MRRLSPEQVRELAAWDQLMRDIKRGRETAAARGVARVPATPPTPRSPLPIPRPAARSAGPNYACVICREIRHLGPRLRCAECDQDIHWRIRLAQQGLRVVW